MKRTDYSVRLSNNPELKEQLENAKNWICLVEDEKGFHIHTPDGTIGLMLIAMLLAKDSEANRIVTDMMKVVIDEDNL